MFIDHDIKDGRKINENLPPRDANAGEESKTSRKEGSVVVKKFNDDGTYQLWLLIDPESGQPLRVPEPGPKIFSEDDVRKLGLSHWDTSRRSGLDFEDVMQMMQEFGKEIGKEVLKKLYGTRGTKPRR